MQSDKIKICSELGFPTRLSPLLSLALAMYCLHQSAGDLFMDREMSNEEYMMCRMIQQYNV